MSLIETLALLHASDKEPVKKDGRRMYLFLISLLKPKPKPVEKPKD